MSIPDGKDLVPDSEIQAEPWPPEIEAMLSELVPARRHFVELYTGPPPEGGNATLSYQGAYSVGAKAASANGSRLLGIDSVAACVKAIKDWTAERYSWSRQASLRRLNRLADFHMQPMRTPEYARVGLEAQKQLNRMMGYDAPQQHEHVVTSYSVVFDASADPGALDARQGVTIDGEVDGNVER